MGFENKYIPQEREVLAKSNVELLEVAEIARILDRPIATPDEARMLDSADELHLLHRYHP